MNRYQSFEMITPQLTFTFNNQAALSKLISDMESSKPQSAIKIESERRPLADDFVPGPYDVICARGASAKKHPGNVRFRAIIHRIGPAYAKAQTKVEKSLLVSEVVDSVRGFSPNGGFVKKFGNRWCEVGDSVAREKIGQCLRDQLHAQYKSSTKAKKDRRKALKKEESKDKPVAAPSKRDSIESFGGCPFPPLPLESQSSMYILKDLPLAAHHTQI